MKKLTKTFTLCNAAVLGLLIACLTACPSGGGGGGGGDDHTPPTVLSVTPSGTGAAVAGNVVITFNEAMDAAPGTVELSGTALPPGGTWSAGNTVFTKPYSGLSLSTSYSIKIYDFKDAAGNVMAEKNSDFITGSTPDTTPPTVVSVTPNGTGAAVAGNMVIIFSEIIDTAGPGTVNLNGAAFSGTWSADKTELTVTYSGLATGTSYTVIIFGFKDTAGNTMAERTYSFTTAGTPALPIKAGLYDTGGVISPNDEPIKVFDKNNAAATFNEAITYANTNPGVYTLVLDGDVSIGAGSNINSSVTLRIIGQGGNRNISLSSNGALFTVNISAWLVLDNNITLKGKDSNTETLVIVNGGRLTMRTGSAIKDNKLTNYLGGGVDVRSMFSTKGNFTMEGGEISGNNITYTSSGGTMAQGAGVVVSGGIFTMEGGRIINNTCNNNSSDESEFIRGGGVFVVSGTFTMNGGDISSNTATLGGGVYMAGGTFTMSGGKISGNNSVLGGGVAVRGDGTIFTMNNGEISGNSSGVGGGVFVDGNSGSATFTMIAGEIKNNIASARGGGVIAAHGSFTMRGGTISGNTASFYGGGVDVQDEIFNMIGGTISGNTVTNEDSYSEGGGVYMAGGTFTMSGGEISDNTINSVLSISYGGGVYLHGVNFTLTGTAVIKNNKSGGDESFGGGVFACNDTTFTMSGGEISGNNALNGIGGGVFLDNILSTMSGGEISGNTATAWGGGVLMHRGTFTMSNGKIKNNTARAVGYAGGGGVCVDYNGNFTMTGGEISGNTVSPRVIEGETYYGKGGGVYIVVGKFSITGGTIYGSNASPDSLKNTANEGAALFVYASDYAIAEYGKFTGTTYTKVGDLATRNDTIRVVNGALVP